MQTCGQDWKWIMCPAWHCGEPRKNQTAGQWEKEQERKARNIDSV